MGTTSAIKWGRGVGVGGMEDTRFTTVEQSSSVIVIMMSRRQASSSNYDVTQTGSIITL